MCAHLVVAGRVEDVVQGAEAGHQLRVDPELGRCGSGGAGQHHPYLVQQVQLLVHHGVARRHHQRQGQIEGLPSGTTSQIVILKMVVMKSELTQLPNVWKADCLSAVVRL